MKGRISSSIGCCSYFKAHSRWIALTYTYIAKWLTGQSDKSVERA